MCSLTCSDDVAGNPCAKGGVERVLGTLQCPCLRLKLSSTCPVCVCVCGGGGVGENFTSAVRLKTRSIVSLEYLSIMKVELSARCTPVNRSFAVILWEKCWGCDVEDR
jgi:hypothetical protein